MASIVLPARTLHCLLEVKSKLRILLSHLNLLLFLSLSRFSTHNIPPQRMVEFLHQHQNIRLCLYHFPSPLPPPRPSPPPPLFLPATTLQHLPEVKSKRRIMIERIRGKRTHIFFHQNPPVLKNPLLLVMTKSIRKKKSLRPVPVSRTRSKAIEKMQKMRKWKKEKTTQLAHILTLRMQKKEKKTCTPTITTTPMQVYMERLKWKIRRNSQSILRILQ